MMRINKYGIVLLLLTLSIISCSPQQEEKIQIGAIFMLTGVGANWGEYSRNGAELAVNEINAARGIMGKPLEIVYEDNQGDNPKQAVTALQKLVDVQNIKIILGPNWSPSGNAVAPIACEKGVVMISPSLGIADFNEACNYLFNLWPHDKSLSEALAKYIFDKGYRRIAILGSLQVWEREQAEAVKVAFERLGGEVIAFELPAVESDLRTEALKISAAEPEAVVLTNYGQEDIGAKRLREQGVKVQFFSVLLDDKLLASAQGALEGTLFLTSFTPSKRFVEKYTSAYGSMGDIGSDTSYDAVKLIAQAMQETKSTDPTILKDYLNSLKTYQGESGFLTFDGKGGVIKEPRLMIVKDGKMQEYKD